MSYLKSKITSTSPQTKEQPMKIKKKTQKWVNSKEVTLILILWVSSKKRLLDGESRTKWKKNGNDMKRQQSWRQKVEESWG